MVTQASSLFLSIDVNPVVLRGLHNFLERKNAPNLDRIVKIRDSDVN